MPESDLHVLPMSDVSSLKPYREIVRDLNIACLFTLDAGDENALA